MNTSTSIPTEYLCPGETHPISQALHLARMAEFYPVCRNCEHREDTGTLSAKLIKRLKEVWTNGRQTASFSEEGFVGQSPNELTPSVARQAAVAFGLWLRDEESMSESYDAGASGNFVPTPERGNEGKYVCRVAVASDARAIMPEYVAIVCEGLRFAACEAFDIGPATTAAMQFAVAHFQLDGGILLGSANHNPSTICLKFWGVGPQRMLGKSAFQPLQEILRKGLDRPARRFGPQHRLQAETPYLAAFVDQFHGLRPLRFVVDSTSRPWVMYLEKLLQTTACQIVPCRVLPHEFPKQIVADNAHFGIRVTNDGECCTFFDEQGRQFDTRSQDFAVPPDALTALIQLLQALSRDDRPCSAVLDGAA